MVIVFADGSVSIPELAVPPSSFTWKVKLVYLLPLPLGPGVKISLLPLISATGIESFAVTALPLSFKLPFAGNVEIMTADIASPSLSQKPKSDAA